MVLKKPISDEGLMAWLAFTVVFMLIVFDRDFGNIYIAIGVSWLFFYIYDKFVINKKISYPVEKNVKGRGRDFVVALFWYAIILVSTAIIANLFAPDLLSTFSVVEVIKTYSADFYQATKPALRDSVILMVFGWGILIPIAETSLFNGKFFEFIYDKTKKKTILTMIALFMIVGAVAALYHLTSKASSSFALMVTFIFFSVSAFIVWKKGDLRTAIYLHIINNIMAVLSPIIFG